MFGGYSKTLPQGEGAEVDVVLGGQGSLPDFQLGARCNFEAENKFSRGQVRKLHGALGMGGGLGGPPGASCGVGKHEGHGLVGGGLAVGQQ